MVEFLTLFLGLVGGPQLVALDTSPEVAVIQLRLGGEVVGAREHPPWNFEVDFGNDLAPRELEAVAFDDAGREVSRTRQLLNLPRPPAEVRLVLVRDDGSAVVRTHWESAVAVDPTAASVILDGERLALEGATPAERVSVISLPDVDSGVSHLLEVELEFGPEVQASAHLIFGLGPGFQTNAELTAFPVTGGRRLRAEKMNGWFRFVDGERAPKVVAVEKGLADVVVVLGPEVDETLLSLDGMPEGGLSVDTAALGTVAVGSGIDSSNLGGFRGGPPQQLSAEEEVRSALGLPHDIRLRVLLPRARSGSGRRVELDRFLISPDITEQMGGLPRALSLPLDEVEDGGEVRIWDAVALAGLRAAESNRRRAVVLAVAGGWHERSLYSEPAVRRFLEAIRVPLYVWHVVDDRAETAVVGGSAERIHKFSQLRAAARRMRKDVDRQRIVWFEGVHLPSSIQMANGAGVEPVTRR
ncbi:MAG: hypothetical protein MPN21_01990 [Thermoanaerobaculia bacterium]|nr:hypothetical protein [Thermoanaerobaculia bacterium]